MSASMAEKGGMTRVSEVSMLGKVVPTASSVGIMLDSDGNVVVSASIVIVVIEASGNVVMFSVKVSEDTVGSVVVIMESVKPSWVVETSEGGDVGVASVSSISSSVVPSVSIW